MAENLCMSCKALCCKGPATTMSLNEKEHRQMEDAGTTLFPIAEPVDYDRDDVPYASEWRVDLEEGTIEMVLEPGKETEPLRAGLGRYLMLGPCGNLVEVDGVEMCGIHEERPEVCRGFEMGGEKCDLLRLLAQLETTS